jgi:putative MATE family efflux protein
VGTGQEQLAYPALKKNNVTVEIRAPAPPKHRFHRLCFGGARFDHQSEVFLNQQRPRSSSTCSFASIVPPVATPRSGNSGDAGNRATGAPDRPPTDDQDHQKDAVGSNGTVDEAPAVDPGAPPVPLGAAGSAIEQQNMAQQANKPAAALTDKQGKAHLARPEILQGPIHANVFKVALPSVATMLLQTTNGFLDRFFVGQLNAGADALAAITVASSLMFAVMSAAMAISVGTTALVSRFVGEEDEEQSVQAARQSLILAVFAGALVAALMWIGREPLLRALGLAAGPRHLAHAYLHWTLLGMPSMFSMLILNGIFRGMGDTVRPFWVSLGANIVHAIGNYLLIFGNFGFPKLGLPGGALALVVSQLVATGLYLFFLRRTPLRRALSLPRVGGLLSWDWSWRIARIGLPAAAQQLLRVGSMMAFQAILLRTASASAGVAALGVGLVSESIAFMPGFGYSIAASAFVGQNMGARQVKRAHQGAWAATLQAIAVMSVMGVVFYVFAEPFARCSSARKARTRPGGQRLRRRSGWPSRICASPRFPSRFWRSAWC